MSYIKNFAIWMSSELFGKLREHGAETDFLDFPLLLDFPWLKSLDLAYYMS